jgi:hypothetical protein
MPSHSTAKELEQAVALAERVVVAGGAVLDQFKLTSAVSMMASRDYRGPAYWRITFKRRDLVPKDAASELGAGGEIFVDVDLDPAPPRSAVTANSAVPCSPTLQRRSARSGWNGPSGRFVRVALVYAASSSSSKSR